MTLQGQPTVLLHNTRGSSLRADPSRTLSIQARFIADLNKRFLKLRAEILYFLWAQDALDLKKEPGVVGNVIAREFRFNTDPQKLESFNNWFAEQVEAGFFSVPPGTPQDRLWFAEYVDSAYKRGHSNAYLAARAADAIDPESLLLFLSGLSAPESVNKIRLLYLRVFEELKGVTADMSLQMSRILAQGLADGTGPLKIAQQMSRQIRGITRKRAKMIARTEIVRVHAESQLDAFQKLGVQKLGIRAEWTTAGDGRVCSRCAENEGRLFKIEQARGLIPLHPNCRCAFVPFVPLFRKKT